ncbi:MAG TPA: hypothetical protein VID19_10390 [Candidatus Eremiobacteraceae bacterium]|jgi:hypothetical protein
MNVQRFFSILAAVCSAAVVAGCGGGGSSGSSSATATPGAAAAMPAATTEAQRERGSLPLAQAAPVPQGLQCSGDVMVWVNLKSKAYHDSTDPFFGRTKNGKYMCKTDAVNAGYHAAGAAHAHNKAPAPAATASGY